MNAVNGSHPGQVRVNASDLNPIGPPMVPCARKSCRHCRGRGFVGTLVLGEKIQCRCVLLIPVALEQEEPPAQEAEPEKPRIITDG